MLPVELPEVDDFSPRTFDPDDADSDAGAAAGPRRRDWVEVELDLGDGPKRYTRETNTMPQWAGSCWYYLRYLDPHNDERARRPGERGATGWARSATGDCGGVDLYVGGVEHAVLHLLYARFWHKVLYDLGHVSRSSRSAGCSTRATSRRTRTRDEPRRRTCPPRRSSSATAGYFYGDAAGQPRVRQDGQVAEERGHARRDVRARTAPTRSGCTRCRWARWTCPGRGRPGRSSARTGSCSGSGASSSTSRPARSRVADEPPDDETRRLLHRTIDGVRADMDELRFNTAIAKLIELTNALTALAGRRRARSVEPLVLMMAPFAPHIAEELWQRLGHDDSLAYAASRSPTRRCWWPRRSPTRCRSTARSAAGSRSPPDAAEDDGPGGGAGRRSPRTWAAGSPQRSSWCPAAWSASSSSSVGPDRAGSLPWRSGPSPRP